MGDWTDVRCPCGRLLDRVRAADRGYESWLICERADTGTRDARSGVRNGHSHPGRLDQERGSALMAAYRAGEPLPDPPRFVPRDEAYDGAVGYWWRCKRCERPHSRRHDRLMDAVRRKREQGSEPVILDVDV